jgi:hypothetical protein
MLFADDLVLLNIGRLGYIEPGSYRDPDILFTRDGDAIRYELNTHADPPFVTLEYGGTRNSVVLTWQKTICRKRTDEYTRRRRPAFWGNSERPPSGRKWFFVGSEGDRATKLFWIPQVGFDTRHSAHLEYRCRHMGIRKREALVLERNQKKMFDMMRRPTVQKFLILQNHCDMEPAK